MRQTQEATAQAAAAVGLAALHLFGVRIPAFAASFYGPRGLRLVLNVATALLVISLPFAAAQSTLTASAPGPLVVSSATRFRT